MEALNQFIQDFSGFSKLKPEKMDEFETLFRQAVSLEEQVRVVESTFEGVPLDPSEENAISGLFDSIVSHKSLIDLVAEHYGAEEASEQLTDLIKRHARNESEELQIRKVLEMEEPTADQVRKTLETVSAATMLHLAVLLNLKEELANPILEVAANSDWTEEMQSEYGLAFKRVLEKIGVKLEELTFTKLNITFEFLAKLSQFPNFFTSVVRFEELTATNIRGAAEAIKLILKMLSTNASKVKKLELVYCNMDAQALAKILVRMPELQLLNLSSNLLSGNGARALSTALSELPGLRHLELDYNYIDSERAQVLAKGIAHMTGLEYLRLDGNSIKSEGAKYIAKALMKIPGLQYLNLNNNQIGHEGMADLAKAFVEMPWLREIDLSHNSIGDEGVKSLATGLRRMPWLEELNLSKNKIGTKGAKALAGAIVRMLGLQKIDLSDNYEISMEGIMTLAGAVDKMSWLQEVKLYLLKMDQRSFLMQIEGRPSESKLKFNA